MDTLQEEIRDIRKQLRLAMNGVTSTSMREKGIVYKLNFGVPYPEIKEIARTHKPDKMLAEALWGEDVRELKILATFLQPVDEFTEAEAMRWVKKIPYLEIAEACSRNLFVHLPYMEDFTFSLIHNVSDKFARTLVFLTWAEHLKRGGEVSEWHLSTFHLETMRSATCNVFGANLAEKQAAILAMKFYGRQSERQEKEILDGFDNLQGMFEDRPELSEIYNDLKFEFDYYK